MLIESKKIKKEINKYIKCNIEENKMIEENCGYSDKMKENIIEIEILQYILKKIKQLEDNNVNSRDNTK